MATHYEPRLICRRVFLRNNFRTFEPGFAEDGKRTCVDVFASSLLSGSCAAHKVCTACKGISLLCGSRPGRSRAGLETDLSSRQKVSLASSLSHRLPSTQFVSTESSIGSLCSFHSCTNIAEFASLLQMFYRAVNGDILIALVLHIWARLAAPLRDFGLCNCSDPENPCWTPTKCILELAVCN